MDVTAAKIEQMIYFIRGLRVMLDSDLAELYGVETKRLNEQVRRNPERFPEDFMFECTTQELDVLQSQFATAKRLTLGIQKEEIFQWFLLKMELLCFQRYSIALSPFK